MQASIIDVEAIKNIMDSYKGSKYLKQRTYSYISKHIENFYIIKYDEQIFSSFELIESNEWFLELGAFTVFAKLGSREKYTIAILSITYAIVYAKSKGKTIISLTNNEKLVRLYEQCGFQKPEEQSKTFLTRQIQSPWVQLYYIS